MGFTTMAETPNVGNLSVVVSQVVPLSYDLEKPPDAAAI
jgi:hypothetical protein